MSSITANGQPLEHITYTSSKYGAWVADVKTTNEIALTGRVTLVVGDLTVQGVAARSSAFTGDTYARVVGARGETWQKRVVARGYSQPSGLALSVVLRDLARECGEVLTLDADRNVGTFYVRASGPAERTLAALLGGAWWTDDTGTTQTRARPSSAIVTPFSVVSWDGATKRAEVRTDYVSHWAPGRTFTDPRIVGTQTISQVTVTSGADGVTRVSVLATGEDDRDRSSSGFRALARATFPELIYSGSWEYRITGASEGSANVEPLDDRMPALDGVPLFPGLLSELVTPTVGALCRVRFVNQDPKRPEIESILGYPATSKVYATGKVKIGGAGSAALAKSAETSAAINAVGVFCAAVGAAATANPAVYAPFALAVVTATTTLAAALPIPLATIATTTAEGL